MVFDRSHTSSSWHSIVIMALPCIIAIKCDIRRRSNFLIPHLHLMTVLGGCSHQNIAISFGTENLEWCGYSIVNKFDGTFSCFDTMPACDRQMDILWQHSLHYAYASRGKNCLLLTVLYESRCWCHFCRWKTWVCCLAIEVGQLCLLAKLLVHLMEYWIFEAGEVVFTGRMPS